MTIRPLVHAGDSANIASYAERGQEGAYVWAEVLRDDIVRRDGKLVRRPVPHFGLTVYRYGVGEIARKTYKPNTRPRPGPLPDRTVTRLVREILAEKADSHG